jgi:hypothetical protein
MENGFGDDQPEHSGTQQRSVDDGQAGPPAVGVGDDDHRIQHGEGRPGHHRHPDADDLGDADRLQHRGDTGDQQVGADEQGDV